MSQEKEGHTTPPPHNTQGLWDMSMQEKLELLQPYAPQAVGELEGDEMSLLSSSRQANRHDSSLFSLCVFPSSSSSPS